jgi:hypothetical protein
MKGVKWGVYGDDVKILKIKFQINKNKFQNQNWSPYQKWHYHRTHPTSITPRCYKIYINFYAFIQANTAEGLKIFLLRLRSKHLLKNNLVLSININKRNVIDCRESWQISFTNEWWVKNVLKGRSLLKNFPICAIPYIYTYECCV